MTNEEAIKELNAENENNKHEQKLEGSVSQTCQTQNIFFCTRKSALCEL